MLHDKMSKALNEQMNWELYSSYIYLAMSAHFEQVNLRGFAHWMRVQTMEEITHFKRFYDFLTARGGRVVLSQIKAPPSEWKSPLDAFEDVLKHEQEVTRRIHHLADLAVELKDHATGSLLKWFIDEQVEEEASTDEIIQNLKLNQDAPSGLYLIDKELAARAFTVPPDISV